MLDKLSQMTDDPLALQRISMVADMTKDVSGVLAFIAQRARVQLQQDDRQRAEENRQKDELIRSLEASLAAQRCEEVASGNR